MAEKLDSKFGVEYDGWQKQQEQIIHTSTDSNQQLDLVREAGPLRRGSVCVPPECSVPDV